MHIKKTCQFLWSFLKRKCKALIKQMTDFFFFFFNAMKGALQYLYKTEIISSPSRSLYTPQDHFLLHVPILFVFVLTDVLIK